jgi:phage shock protein PspC (stress-responsive transcriptional regulator)
MCRAPPLAMICAMTTADAPPHEVRRLTRARDGRLVAGVCGGIARYFDIDPVIPRVILAVLAVFGGAGIVIYAAAWLLLPEDGQPATRVEHWLAGRHTDRRRDLAIVFAVLVVVLVVFRHDPFALRLSGAAVIILVIMAAAALLDRRHAAAGLPWTLVGRRRGTGAPADTTPTGVPTVDLPADSTAATAAPGPFATTAYPSGGWPFAAEPWVAPVKARRPRSWLGWLTVGAMLLVVGGFSLVGASGAAHPQPADVIAAAVAVVGVALLIGAVFGRAWLMIPVGVLLLGMLGVADAVPRNLTWSSGSRDWVPASSVPSNTYVLGAGKAILDLSAVSPTASTTVTSRLGAGRLIVYVPAQREILVDAHLSAGRLYLFGHEYDGTGLHERWTLTPAATIGPPMHLNLDAGFADVEVRRA